MTSNVSVDDTLEFTDSAEYTVTPTPPEPPTPPTPPHVVTAQDDSAQLTAMFKERMERERKANKPKKKKVSESPVISQAVHEENRRRMAILMELLDD